MAFKPDPKPVKKVNSKTGDKLKWYTCRYCKERYEMSAKEYGQRSLTASKRSCKKVDCMLNAAGKYFEQKSKEERKEWGKRKEILEKDVGSKKSKIKRDPLQDSINRIAVLMDKEFPCLARPFNTDNRIEGGHVLPRSRHGSIKYHLWNIHGQGHISNSSQKDDLLMLEGLEIRYGKERREYVEALPKKYPILKLALFEKKAALKIANQIIRELEKGKVITRDQANERIGIYK